MPRRSPRAPLALAALTTCVALGLTGCLPTEPRVTPPPSSPAEPVYASDDEALAAAEAAYDRYLRMVETILADGGEEPERLLEVAGPEEYAIQEPGFAELRDDGLSGTGEVAARLTLQQYELSGEVVAYVCEDIRDTDLVNERGESVVLDSRATFYSYQVTFTGNPLLVHERVPWQGSGICA